MRWVRVLLAVPFAMAAPIVPVVHVASGTLAGKVLGSTSVFQGIPFAAPPVGDLRWRPPQPVANWSGIRDATNAGSPCMQSTYGVDSFLAPLAAEYGVHYAMEALKPSEDCLYLNVFSPAAAKRLPVMVWLHGGSNRAGSGSGDGYDGASLASHGVIVVTMNYRLGAMGFFAHPGLTAESPHHSSGNYGLLDQIAGLKWVQQNIEQFGGDPGNVTLFGESAGSVDATMLMASPLVKGLFRRVIAESGPAFGLGPPVMLAQAEAVGKAINTAAALRKMPAQQVAELDARMVASRFKGFDPNSAVVDGWLLPRPPAVAFASGSTQKVDLMAGFNGRELSAFRIVAEAAATAPPKEPATAAVKKLADAAYPLYGAWTDMAVGMYLAQILVHGNSAVDRASNDMLVACPVGAEIALVTRLGARAYLYRFDRSIPGKGEQKLGAFHALELPFVFQTFSSRSWRWLPVTQADRNLSAVMESYWTNFAKSGDPNGAGLPVWKAWNSDDEPYLQFSPSAVAVPQRSFAPPFCHLGADRLRERLGGGR
jgi:para-nitrobenzyl esterase